MFTTIVQFAPRLQVDHLSDPSKAFHNLVHLKPESPSVITSKNQHKIGRVVLATHFPVTLMAFLARVAGIAQILGTQSHSLSKSFIIFKRVDVTGKFP